MKTRIIGIAELDVVKAPDKIATLGLGSCCGVVLYDSKLKIAGMVHIMLPSSQGAQDVSNRAKFADTGIHFLIEKMEKSGARRAGLSAKIAGGAHMFAFAAMQSDLLKVGERNVNVCLDVLSKLRIPIVAKDVLGTYGRTITFDTTTGMLNVKSVGKGEKEI